MAWMFVVFVLCCAGSGFSDELIASVDVFYRACVCNCVWSRNLKTGRVCPIVSDLEISKQGVFVKLCLI
jgi:hypothetical protein